MCGARRRSRCDGCALTAAEAAEPRRGGETALLLMCDALRVLKGWVIMSERTYGPYSFETSKEDKTLFPEASLTKGDLIEYYEKIAEYMLPHIEDRPVTMQRFPDGIEQQGFYEKRVPDYFPAWMVRVKVNTDDGTQAQITCNNEATLAYLANQACITPHVWLSRSDHLNKPDQMIFDLDPPDGGHFEAVRDAAKKCKALLDEMDAAAFVKTTGSRGVHLVLPLRPHDGFDEVRRVCPGAG